MKVNTTNVNMNLQMHDVTKSYIRAVSPDFLWFLDVRLKTGRITERQRLSVDNFSSKL